MLYSTHAGQILSLIQMNSRWEKQSNIYTLEILWQKNKEKIDIFPKKFPKRRIEKGDCWFQYIFQISYIKNYFILKDKLPSIEREFVSLVDATCKFMTK